MAVRESNRWSNRHACITCASGNGKGIAVSSLGLFPPRVPLVIFDPYGEYKTKFGTRKCHGYKTQRGFARAFKDAWRNGRPFTLSYSPPSHDTDRLEEMEWFGKLVWAASDGERLLSPLFEEFGKCTESISKDDTVAGEIATGGRKFGLRAGFVFQRSAEVPKTIWGNCSVKVIGAQEYTTDAKRIVDQLGCTMDDVAELGKLNKQFAMYSPKYDDFLKTKVHYMVGEGMRNYTKQAAIVYPNRAMVKKWSYLQRHLHKNSPYQVINPEILK